MENGFPAGLLLCGADLPPARGLAVPARRTAVAPLVHRTQIPAAPTSQRRILWRRAISVCIFVASGTPSGSPAGTDWRLNAGSCCLLCLWIDWIAR
jgi:hypothetical protein